MEHVTYKTDAEIDAYMKERGMYFYREYFMWGRTPAYRNFASTIFRFFDRGDILTPAEMLARLLDDWRPVAREEYNYASHALRRELEALSALEVTN